MSSPSTSSRQRTPTSSGRSLLERTLARLRRERSAERPRQRMVRRERKPAAQLSAAAFRAVVDERLRSLERQLDEVKGRVNGLIFLLAGTVAAQLILRLAG